MRSNALWLLALALGFSLHIQAKYTVVDSLCYEESHGVTLRDSIVCYAMEYLGTPYRYGGESPKGFDCSGFTKYVFDAFDVCLSRSSRYQAGDGNPVDLDQVQKGDILIFKGTNPKSKVPGHVGIVISDPGEPIQFVHASSSKRESGIKVSALEGYYRSRLLQSRDVLNIQ